jgi:LPS-assembly lipoprotein
MNRIASFRHYRFALRSLALAGLLLLGSCGFHLQGRLPLPESIRAVHVATVDEQSDFVQALRESLVASGARLMPLPSPAAATLQVSRDQVTERVLTVSARNIPTDYELTYEVEVSVRGAGRELMAPQQLTLSRVYSFDERKLLAKDREKGILLEALARDMAGIVMRRLSALQ